MMLTEPQRLVLRNPLPLLSGQTVEVLVMFDEVSSQRQPAEVSSLESWTEFLDQRNDQRAKYPVEVEDFTLNRVW